MNDALNSEASPTIPGRPGGRNLLAALVLAALSACAAGDLSIPRSPLEDAGTTAELRTALETFGAELRANPSDPGARARYVAAVERAENTYLDHARRFAAAERFSEAEAVLSRGLVLLPESQALRQELVRVSEARQARSVYRDARVASELGRTQRAIDLAERALGLDPNYTPALDLLRRLDARALAEETVEPVRLQTGALVTVNFQNASFKDAVLSLGRAYGVNMVFDADLQDRQVSLFAERVTFSQAFGLLLKANRAFYRRVGSNTVIIANDIPAKRDEYSDYMVRTFFVNSGNAETIAQTLITTLGLQAVSVDPAQNSITVRATADELRVADRMINVNDRRPAEVVLEVEVLEVNRTKSEQLGIDFGSQIAVTPGALQISDVTPLSAFGNALGGSALTLPAATLRFFKQDVDARTLASPRIRALNRETAVFHVGDEVPLRATEIVDANGQTRTTFERRDIGIKLQVVPVVQLNSAVEVLLDLEVSSLGQNLGTAEESAYVIGTRTVQTRMLLEDGETAIIGGLIRDEERDSVISLPGGKKTSPLGQLFRSRDGQASRTDIILTLQPRVVRKGDLPSVAESSIFSGSGNRVSSVNTNDFMAGSDGSNLPVIELSIGGAARPAVTPPPPSLGGQQGASGAGPSLSFSNDSFVANVGDSFDVGIIGGGFPSSAAPEITIRFNASLLTANGVSGDGLQSEIDNDRGVITVSVPAGTATGTSSQIGSVNFTARSSGFASILFANSGGALGSRGLPGGTVLRNARVIVR